MDTDILPLPSVLFRILERQRLGLVALSGQGGVPLVV